MKKCTEITELLSAYSDNELTDKEKLSVEEHLAACENCSALLEIYREISISVEESSAPVPDALRIGVMNRIQSEAVPSEKETKKKKWWQHQVILTRLAPIAACLAVVLLVWQFSGNMFSLNEAAPMPAPMMAPMPAPAAADVAPAPAPEIEYSWSTDDGALEEADLSMPAEAAGNINEHDSSSSEAEPAPTMEPGGRRLDDLESQIARETEIIFEYIGRAYAEITITGELPEFLAEHIPLPLDNWSGWDLIYEIPSTEVDELMAELINRPGTSLVQNPNNQNSPFAIVFFLKG